MDINFPKAVFWDWDGTLVDSYSFLNDAHNFTLKALEFEPFKEGEYRKYFGKPRKVLYPAIYKDKSDEAVEIFQKYVLENSHKVQTMPDSEKVLDLLYKRNIPMGIVSNKKANLIRNELKKFGWEKYFKVVVGSGDACLDKPSSAPLLLAIEKSGINIDKNNYSFSDIFYIGDTENDLLCAKELGCKPIFFLNNQENSQYLVENYNPLIKFNSYKQLESILVAL